MLKISMTESRKQRRLVLEGKLIAPWTTELRIACEQADKDPEGRELVVELKNITVISQEGERLLGALREQGVMLRGHGVLAKEVLRQLASEARTQSMQASSSSAIRTTNKQSRNDE